MRRVLKNMILAVLILTMALPTNYMVNASDKGFEIRESYEKSEKAVLSADLIGYTTDEEEMVRVIVELEDAPIIEYATEKGVKVDDLTQGFIDSKTDELLDVQEEVIEDFDYVVSKFEVHEQFTNVFNGFSTTVKYGDLTELASIPEVKSVSLSNEYERPEPQMVNSSKLTQSKMVNEDYGYTGEGMVVAIIDTGIDASHKDFVLDAGTEVKLSEKDIENFIFDEGLLGKFYTEKVPYGYNYMDGNNEILDLGVEASMHGMHVAGTVAANGDEDNGGIQGVAPNAQVLALKVFGNDPEYGSTFGDIIIAAIDDAIILGADVMNLSLGSTAAFVDETDPEQMAVTNATENGILMSISAGNSARFGYGADEPKPFAENPDVGVVGAPGITSESLQVASVNNELYLYETTAIFTGIEASVLGYGKDMWDTSETYELVAIGGTKLGAKSDYDGIDVTGKVVLVSRGEFSFYDKTETAANMGAAGIVVYDHGLSTFYKNQGGWSVPFMMISQEVGLELEALLEENDSLELTAAYGENGQYIDPVSGLISDFSSWGTTPDLSFKPEIAAPGGNIYSTLNNDSYGYMSGTSMAAPHVSGGAALMLERINEDSIFDGVDMDAQEAVVLAKNILMNTAQPVLDSEYGYTYASPRQQGAGSMNLKYAMDTEVVVTDTTTGLAKVNMGEIETNVLTFDLEIKNYGDSVASYLPESSVQAMYGSGGYNYMVPVPLAEITYADTVGDDAAYLGSEYSAFYIDGVEVPGYVTVPAGETVELTVKIVVDPSEINWMLGNFYNGFFLEGYVTLYTDDAVLGETLYYAYLDMATAEAAVLEKTEDVEAAELEVDEITELLTTTNAAITVASDELTGMEDALAAVEDKYDAITEKEVEVETLQAIYESDSYLFALLVGDAAEVVVTAEILSGIIDGYEAKLESLKMTIADTEGLLADLEELQKQKYKKNREKRIESLEEQLADLVSYKEQIEDELAQFEVVMDDFELYGEVYVRMREKVALAEEELDAAIKELEKLVDGLTDEDQEVIDTYNAKVEEIEELEAAVGKLSDELEAAQETLDELNDELAEIEAAYAAAFATYQSVQGEYLKALPLSVPYISYFGDWSTARAFDVSAYEQNAGLGLYSFYGETYMITVDSTEDDTIYFNYLGVKDGSTLDDSVIAISPNGDGLKDTANARFSALRNIKNVTFRVEDEDGELVLYTGAYPELRKNYYDGGYGQKSYILTDMTWDGNTEDGQYYYIIEGELADGTIQELSFPVYVDTVSPIVESIEYKNGSDTLTVNASDVGVGVDEYVLYDVMTGEILLSSYTTDIDLTELNGQVYIAGVAIFDYAGNIGYSAGYATINDDDIPEVRLDLEPFSVLEERDFEVSGVVYEMLGPVVSIDGQEMEIADDGTFTYSASYESDGKKSLLIEASDFAGNDISFRRQFFIDSYSPVIQSINDDFFKGSEDDVVYVTSDVETYAVQAVVSDNFPDLTVRINKDAFFVSSVDFVSYEALLQPVTADIDVEYDLDAGYNEFVIEGTDVTGKTTTETIIVYRAADGEILPGKKAAEVKFGEVPESLYIGESFELEYTSTLVDETVELNSERALITTTPNFSRTGRVLEATVAGLSSVTVMQDGVEATATILVVEPVATDVSIVSSGIVEIDLEESYFLNYMATYEDGSMVTNPDEAIITVDNDVVSVLDREVIGAKAGKAVITIKVGEVEDTLEVTVTEIDEDTADEDTADEDTSDDDTTTSSSSGSSKKSSTPTISVSTTEETTVEEMIVIIEDEISPLASPLFKSSTFIKGYEDGTFRPEGDITRAEMSAIINRVVTLTEASESAFTDVEASFWAISDIAAMESAGLIKGFQGEFKPNDNITKAEMATILSRIITLTGADVEIIETPYTDLEGHWGSEDIIRVYSNGIEITEGATTFNPDENLTRAEAVVMINQLIGVELVESNINTFSDVDLQHWAYADIISASN